VRVQQGSCVLRCSAVACCDGDCVCLNLQTARATPSARWARPRREPELTRTRARICKAGIRGRSTKPSGRRSNPSRAMRAPPPPRETQSPSQSPRPARPAMHPRAPPPLPQATQLPLPRPAHPLPRPSPRAVTYSPDPMTSQSRAMAGQSSRLPPPEGAEDHISISVGTDWGYAGASANVYNNGVGSFSCWMPNCN
jgi:hypothetical protein